MGQETDNWTIDSSCVDSHLPSYLSEVCHSNSEDEGFEEATDHAILDSFLRKPVSFSSGPFWLLH